MTHTTNNADLLTPRIADDIETSATSLASTNHVEEAWFLRGVAAALAGKESEILDRETHAYRRFYSAGYNSIRDARAMLGV